MDDVLVKIVRVIANLSINEEIGPEIAASDTCIDLLIQTLGKCNDKVCLKLFVMPYCVVLSCVFL